MQAHIAPRLSALALAVAAAFPTAVHANPVVTGTFVSDTYGLASLFADSGPQTALFTPYAGLPRANASGAGEPAGPQTVFGIATQDSFGLQIEAGVASRPGAFNGGLGEGGGLAGLNGGALWTFNYTNATAFTQRATFTYGFTLSTIHRLAEGATGGQGLTTLSLELSSGGTMKLGDLVRVTSAGPQNAGDGLAGSVSLNSGAFTDFAPVGVTLGPPGSTFGFNSTDFLVTHEFIDIAPGATRQLSATLNLAVAIGFNPATPGSSCCAGLAPYCLTTEAVMGTREGFWGWSFAPVGGGNGGGGNGGGTEIPLPATLALAAAGIAGLAAARRRRAH